MQYNSTPSANNLSSNITIAIIFILFISGILFSFAILVAGIHNPILDIYYFRQTQTAITAYWIAQGGPWLAYETPVLGAPWAIPFEFPVYQLIVAAVSKAHVPLDVAGRLVNYAFFVLVLLPLGMLARTLTVSRTAYLSVAALFLFSPLYVYYSRTVLIETCALFFGALWLALLAAHLKRARWVLLLGAVASGSLAVLAKSTTFPSFLVLGGVATTWVLFQQWRAGTAWRAIALIAGGALVAAAVPLMLGLGWVAYSDAVKSANAFGAHLTSEALARWNFGGLSQKFSASLWKDIVFGRIMPDVLGSLSLIGIAAILVAVRPTRAFALAVLAVIAFLVPIAIFTNLHMVHTYYQLANGLFIVIAVGLCIGMICDNGRPLLALSFLLLLIGGQVYYFAITYKPAVDSNQFNNQLYRAALVARDNTTPDQSIIVFGDDWSSAVNYYAERKGIAMPSWTPRDLFERVLADPQRFLGDRPLGAIVVCAFGLPENPLPNDFIAHRRLIAQVDACRVFSGERN